MRDLTIPEAAEFIDKSVETIRYHLKNGNLPKTKKGKRVFINEKDLFKLVKKERNSFAQRVRQLEERVADIESKILSSNTKQNKKKLTKTELDRVLSLANYYTDCYPEDTKEIQEYVLLIKNIDYEDLSYLGEDSWKKIILGCNSLKQKLYETEDFYRNIFLQTLDAGLSYSIKIILDNERIRCLVSGEKDLTFNSIYNSKDPLNFLTDYILVQKLRT